MKNNRFGKSLGGGLNGHDFLFDKIISRENMFAAWREFQENKRNKADVVEFAEKAEENLFRLIGDLKSENYSHGKYIKFFVCDPKLRKISKASARDRILHHAVHRILSPIFDCGFIFDSHSSRKERGIHFAGKRFCKFALKLSRNHTKTVWVLQADIRKFFDSVDHEILLSLLHERIKGKKTMRLLEIIVCSFETSVGKGIPLGNLTSQLFSNVYLNPADQFIKRELKVKCYLRYADDISILSRDCEFLKNCLLEASVFVDQKLKLSLHPQKISLRKWSQGIDFLGYVQFPFHSVLRTKTKKRMLKKLGKKYADLKNGIISEASLNQSRQSYLGVLGHCAGRGIQKMINTNAINSR